METKLEPATKTVSFSPTHFSDIVLFARYRMMPSEATLYVGESDTIRIAICERLISTIGRRVWSWTPWGRTPPSSGCSESPDASNAVWSVTGAGTIYQGSRTDPAVIYTAPAKKPSPNIAWAKLKIVITLRNDDTGELTRQLKEFSTKITILDRAYKASGPLGPEKMNGGFLT